MCGDRNAKYFLSHANSRCKRNTISGMCNAYGCWVTGLKGISMIFKDYKTTLFTSQGVGSNDVVFFGIED